MSKLDIEVRYYGDDDLVKVLVNGEHVQVCESYELDVIIDAIGKQIKDSGVNLKCNWFDCASTDEEA